MLVPATYLVDTSGQQWLLAVNNAPLITTTPVSGQVAVASVFLNDSATGNSFRLTIVPNPPPAGKQWGDIDATQVAQGGYALQLFVNAPNGNVYAIQISNGLLQVAVAQPSVIDCVSPIVTLAGNVQDRLEEPRGPGIFWQLNNELLPLLVEAMNAFTLITGEQQIRQIQVPFTIPASTSFTPLAMPSDAVALLRVEGPASLAFDKCWITDLDRHFPGWTTVMGDTPQMWFPFGLTKFGIYPNLTAPATVILTYIQLPVPSPRPYTGSEVVPFQAEYFDGLQDYAAAMARLKEGTAEFQESLVLYQRFLAKAEELSSFSYRKGSLRFSRSLGVQSNISDALAR